MSKVIDLSTYRPSYMQVPELGVAQVVEVVTEISERDPSVPSYGAYIVRQGGLAVVELVMDTLKIPLLLPPEEEKYALKAMSFGPEYTKYLPEPGNHNDEGHQNSLTAHHTFWGIAEFAMLNGPNFELIHDANENRRLKPNFFKTGEYPGKLPTNIWMGTVIYPEDVLLFDHSKLHAFRDLTPDRRSRGHYWLV
jgi:hypothetical protein